MNADGLVLSHCSGGGSEAGNSHMASPFELLDNQTERRGAPSSYSGQGAVSLVRMRLFESRDQASRLDEVAGFESFREFLVGRGQQPKPLGCAVMTAPQPRQAHGDAEFP